MGYFQNFWETAELLKSQTLETADWRCCKFHQFYFGKTKSDQGGNNSQDEDRSDKDCNSLVQQLAVLTKHMCEKISTVISRP